MEKRPSQGPSHPQLPTKNRKLFIIIKFAIIIVTVIIIATFLRETTNKTNNKIVIYKGTGEANNSYFQVDLSTKVLESYIDEKQKFINFTGLPQITETTGTKTSLSRTLLSQDESKAIVTFSVYDTTIRNEHDGSYRLIERKEFLCIIETEQCSSSIILEKATKSEPNIRWKFWDSSKNLFFGYPIKNVNGPVPLVVIYNIDNGTSLKTTKNTDCSDRSNKECASVLNGSLSPSLQKLILIDDWQILLYKIDNLLTPYRTFDVSHVRDTRGLTVNPFWDGIDTLAWATNENLVALGTNRSIYTLDLETGTTSLKFTDSTQGVGLLYWDHNLLQFSPSNRFIAFIDYDGYYENSRTQILRAIDLNNGEVIEITRDETVFLIEH